MNESEKKSWSECIPGPSNLNESCRTALEFAAATIEREAGTNNGQTALYWHLVAIAEGHTAQQTEGT